MRFVWREIVNGWKTQKKSIVLVGVTFLVAMFVMLVVGEIIKYSYHEAQKSTAGATRYVIELEGINDLFAFAKLENGPVIHSISYNLGYSYDDSDNAALYSDESTFVFPEKSILHLQEPRMKKGVWFSEQQLAKGEPVMVVNETLGKAYALGSKVNFLGKEVTIIGVCDKLGNEVYIPGYLLNMFKDEEAESMSISGVYVEYEHPLDERQVSQIEKALHHYTKYGDHICSFDELSKRKEYKNMFYYLLIAMFIALFALLIVLEQIQYRMKERYARYCLYQLFGMQRKHVLVAMLCDMLSIFGVAWILAVILYETLFSFIRIKQVSMPLSFSELLGVSAVLIVLTIGISIPKFIRMERRFSIRSRISGGGYNG